MGALGHYLEAAGVPTTQISLIREHTVAIHPPRALWVPFELGRPLGVPNDPGFQRRVLEAALQLFERREGPVLVDYPEEVPQQEGESRASLETLACPVDFTPAVGEESGIEKLLSALSGEVTEFRSWYDLEIARRGYSTVAYFTPEAAGKLLSDFLRGNSLEYPGDISSPAGALRFAAQDLKAAYFEAVMSRPDLSLPTEAEFNRWFWQKTAAGEVLRLIRDTCLASDDEQLRMTGGMLLIPMDQG